MNFNMATCSQGIEISSSYSILAQTVFAYEIETEDFYRDIAKDIERRLDTSGYSKDDNRSLPIEKRFRKIT